MTKSWILFWIAMSSALPATAGWTPLPPWQHIEEVAQRCASCHGTGGQGINPMFPKLAGQNAGYLERQMLNFQRGLRSGPVMLYQLSDLAQPDISALAQYFAGLSRQSAPAITDLAVTGAHLYAEPPQNGTKGCAECHGNDGRGSHSTPRLAGQHAAYLSDQMNRFRNGSRLAGQTTEHPRVPYLTDQEVTALSHYLSTLR